METGMAQRKAETLLEQVDNLRSVVDRLCNMAGIDGIERAVEERPEPVCQSRPQRLVMDMSASIEDAGIRIARVVTALDLLQSAIGDDSPAMKD